MDQLDRSIAAAAERIAPILRELGVRWKRPGGRGEMVPGAADVALALAALVTEVRPGTRVDGGGMAVDWPDHAETGPADSIRFYVLVSGGPTPPPRDVK